MDNPGPPTLASPGCACPMWDASRDPMFEATLLPEFHGWQLSRVMFSVFHAVSAFCNGGLSLSRNDLASYSWHWNVYGVILPLMIIGAVNIGLVIALESA